MDVPIISRQQCRQLDRRATEEFGVPSIVLMENAGRGVADKIEVFSGPQAKRGPIVICCGMGNNGGDGFVIARHLELRGWPVRVLLWAEPAKLKGDAEVNFHILKQSAVPIEVFAGDHDAARLAQLLGGAAWIVDALLGTGATGEPRPPLDQVIRQINDHAAPKLAVDLPSGLDCDTGHAASATIIAAHTCTFVAQKPGFLLPGAKRYTGEVHILDIGAPRKLIEEMIS